MNINFIADYEVEGLKKSTIQECLDYCSNKKELGIDIETSSCVVNQKDDVYKGGLDPFLSSVIMLQLGDENEQFVIDTRCTDVSSLLPLLNSKEIVWVGANLKFEAKHLSHQYKVIFNKIWDCMLVEQNLTNGLELGYSLAKMSERYLGIKPVQTVDLFTVQDEEDVFIDKSTRMEFINIGDKKFTFDQISYGANDIIYPLQIKKMQEQGRNGYNPTKLHELENEFCLVLADIELKGITFDKEKWVKVAETKKLVYESRLKKLNDYIEVNHLNYCTLPDLFNTEKKCNIQWTSSQQVVELFKEIGFCPKEKSKETGKLEYTVGAKALSKLLTSKYKELFMKDIETSIITQEDLILNFLLFKKAEQAITTFGKDFLKYVHPVTGKLHSTYKQILNTGRISSRNPNLQNIPADKEYRECFIAGDNNILINSDYNSQESRILAEVSGDPAMLSFFNDGHPIFGEDYHSFTATKMFSLLRGEPDLVISKETHREERDAAKAISFKIS